MRDTSFPFSRLLLRRSKKAGGRGNEDERQDKERSQAAPGGPDSRKWYKIMKRSNGTCWTSRGAVGRPRRRDAGDLELGQTGPERSNTSKDEARSRAAVKRARHLSRTCVPLARTFPYFSFLLLIRPVPHYSRISYDFLPEMFIYDETATRR